MPRLTLVTIPISHYCEKARWALDRAALDYREDGHLPLLHMLATRPRGGRSVPLLVTPDGVLKDSTDILAWVDRQGATVAPLYPADPAERAAALALEERFDRDLGPHVRRVGYFHLLPVKALVLRIVTQGAAAWQRPMLSPLFPALRALMVRSMRITPEGSARSTDKIRQVFADVSALLEDGRRYLVGPAFTAADLTFAALAAPLLFPPGHPLAWPAEHERPASLRALTDELLATAAGAYALRIYRDHRGTVHALA